MKSFINGMCGCIVGAVILTFAVGTWCYQQHILQRYNSIDKRLDDLAGRSRL